MSVCVPTLVGSVECCDLGLSFVNSSEPLWGLPSCLNSSWSSVLKNTVVKKGCDIVYYAEGARSGTKNRIFPVQWSEDTGATKFSFISLYTFTGNALWLSVRASLEQVWSLIFLRLAIKTHKREYELLLDHTVSDLTGCTSLWTVFTKCQMLGLFGDPVHES